MRHFSFEIMIKFVIVCYGNAANTNETAFRFIKILIEFRQEIKWYENEIFTFELMLFETIIVQFECYSTAD